MSFILNIIVLNDMWLWASVYLQRLRFDGDLLAQKRITVIYATVTRGHAIRAYYYTPLPAVLCIFTSHVLFLGNILSNLCIHIFSVINQELLNTGNKS